MPLLLLSWTKGIKCGYRFPTDCICPDAPDDYCIGLVVSLLSLSYPTDNPHSIVVRRLCGQVYHHLLVLRSWCRRDCRNCVLGVVTRCRPHLNPPPRYSQAVESPEELGRTVQIRSLSSVPGCWLRLDCSLRSCSDPPHNRSSNPFMCNPPKASWRRLLRRDTLRSHLRQHKISALAASNNSSGSFIISSVSSPVSRSFHRSLRPRSDWLM